MMVAATPHSQVYDDMLSHLKQTDQEYPYPVRVAACLVAVAE